MELKLNRQFLIDLHSMSDQPTQQKGFTLVELLIAMALALVIIGSLSSSFIFQRKTYSVQEQITEMNQNARAAMDIMSRDIMMTGYGIAKSSYSNLSTWIDWGSVTFGSDPVVLATGSGALGSDIIHIAGCVGGTVATLDSAESAGTTDIDVSPVDASKSVSELFDTSDEKLICIDGIENAVVTAVSGNTLTIDTDPPNGTGLLRDHRSGASVCVVKIVTYSIVDDGGGSYTLKRNENLGGGAQPLAENIVNMQFTQVTDTNGNVVSIEIDPLTAQTDQPDPEFSQNQGHRRISLRAYVTPPNLSAVGLQ